MAANNRITIILNQNNLWIRDVVDKSILFNHLLNTSFGTTQGTTGEKAEMIDAQKIVKARKIIKGIKEKNK